MRDTKELIVFLKDGRTLSFDSTSFDNYSTNINFDYISKTNKKEKTAILYKKSLIGFSIENRPE